MATADGAGRLPLLDATAATARAPRRTPCAAFNLFFDACLSHCLAGT